LLPDGITIGPELAREVLVDDDSLLARGGVAFVEESAGPQWDLHRLQIVLIDHTREDRWALPWRVLHAFRADAPRAISAERQYIAQSHCLDSWQGGNGPDDAVEIFICLGAAVEAPWRVHAPRHRMLWLKPEI